MRRNRNAKIVATLGPASSSPELIRALFNAGADVFRLNFSHGTHDDHKRRFDAFAPSNVTSAARLESCRTCRGRKSASGP